MNTCTRCGRVLVGAPVVGSNDWLQEPYCSVDCLNAEAERRADSVQR